MSLQTRILAAATALHAGAGMLVATAVTGPLLAVDDLAYLALGRTIGGGGEAPMAAQPPYGVVYPGLLAPGWALGLDEGQMLVWARVVNSLLGALLVPVLFVLVRRITGAAFGRSLVAALVGASLPAALLTGSIVWTERLLPLLVAVAAVMIVRLCDAGSLWAAAGAIAAGVGLYATHPRMGPAAVVVFVAVAVQLVRRDSRRTAALMAVAGVIGVGIAELVQRALATTTFGDTSTYGAADLASRRGLGEAPEMLVHALGTVTYLGLATAGLAIVGVVMLWRSPELRTVYLAMLGAVVVMAGWFLTGVGRSDAYLHGRYVEVMAPLLVALGLIGLRELAPALTVRIVVACGVIGGVYGAWAGPGDIWARPRSPVMMLGTEVGGAPFGGDFFEPGAAATVAVVAGLVLVAASQWRTVPWMPGIVAGIAISLGVWSGLDALDSLQRDSVIGQVQVVLADVEIDHVSIDTERVPPNVAAAVAWDVGLDHASEERSSADRDPAATHALLPSDAPAPTGATLIVELGTGSLWELR